ncbi:MAG: mevalonate kinase [bacterium]|nr:mevalonate kinase [bacterium]
MITALTADASAKIILFGEHAVVYGTPAIAAPVSSLRAAAQVQPEAPGTGLRIAVHDLAQLLPVDPGSSGQLDNALVVTARLVLAALDVPPPDATIHLRSQIPMASGLGSGAAVSTALARALSAYLGQPLELSALNAVIFEVEKLHHHTPSGIDNTVIVYEQPVYYVRSQPIEPIRIGAPLHILIGDTGTGALTKTAVDAVRALYNHDTAGVQTLFDSITTLVMRARSAIEEGDLTRIGRLMDENHAHLARLTVSSHTLDRLVEAARMAGAFGAKLSGGGRGGNMITLVDEFHRPKVEAALLAAGAARVLATTLHPTSSPFDSQPHI